MSSKSSKKGSPTRPKSSKKRGSTPTKGKGSRKPAKSSKKSSRPAKGKGKTSRRKVPPSARGRIHQELVTELPEVRRVKVKSRSRGKAKAAKPDDAEERDPASIEAIMERLNNTYLDEIGAFLLIGMGLLAWLALLSPSSGQIGDAVANALTTSFGLGAYVVAAVVLWAGIALLLPKIGIVMVPNWWRVITGEVFFFFALAYFHATIRYGVGGDAGRIEAFARAAEGRGGGLSGWAIQEAVHTLLGDFTTGVVLLGVLVISGAFTLGVSGKHVSAALASISAWLSARAASLDPQHDPQHDPHYDGQPVAAPVGPAVASSPAPATNGVASVPVNAGEVTIPAASGTAPQPAAANRANEAPPEEAAEPEPAPLNVRLTPEERIEQLREAGEFKERFQLSARKDKRKVRKRSDGLPPLELLDERDYEQPSDDTINYAAMLIEETVEDFGMQVEVVGVKAGPTVTQYAVQPFTQVEKDGEKVVQRVRVTRVAALSQDLSLALSARSVRIQAPVPGTSYIGVEVPNPSPGIVALRPIIESESFYKLKSRLGLALGREVDGTPFAADLAKMPHLLIGGTTGSGKSVCLRTITTCLLMNNTPQQLRLVLIDPKMVELIRFNGVPHLLGKVEIQVDRAIGVLRWVTREMDRRYKLMEEAQSRNIAIYNKGRRKKNRLPRIVVIIDELAELMNEFPDQTEPLVTRLAQMARATGIHLVVATQRPSTDVITGLIKANFPARIGFAVASGADSRVIIDSTGAEDLIGKGDMLYQASDAAGPIRLQGSFVTDEEIENVVRFWETSWNPESDKEKPKVAPWERALTRAAILSRTDPLLEDAIKVVQEDREASASMLQRKLNVGYPRAGRLVDLLEQLGIVGTDPGGGRSRTVLIDPDVDVTGYLVDHRHLIE